MNLNHGDTDSPTFPDEERLMKGDYQSLDSEQAKASTRRARKQTIDFICTIITRVAGGLIVILLLFILASEHKLVTLEQHHHIESNTNSTHAHGEVLKPFVFEDVHKTWKGCGTNVAEARSLGCLYDVMLGGWIHADCYWGEMMEKYLADGEYVWYRDEAMTVEMPLSEVRLGEHHKIWTKKYYHLAHCSYLWNLQMRAFRERVPVDHGIMEEEHTVHCSGILLNQGELNTTSASLLTEFEYCGRPGLD